MDADAGLAARLDPSHLCLLADIHAFGAEPAQHHGGQFGIVLAEGTGRFQHGHVGAEPAMGLRHFHADGAATDDDEMAGLAGLFKQGFVGQVADRIKARNGRHQR